MRLPASSVIIDPKDHIWLKPTHPSIGERAHAFWQGVMRQPPWIMPAVTAALCGAQAAGFNFQPAVQAISNFAGSAAVYMSPIVVQSGLMLIAAAVAATAYNAIGHAWRGAIQLS